MTGKLENAPVYFAVARIGFNPVANLEKYIPSLQDVFRLDGYEEYEISEKQSFEISISEDGEEIEPNLVNEKAWIFRKSDKSSCFISTTTSFAYQTTAYDRSREFYRDLLEGFSKLSDAVRLSKIQSIGIRFFDAILPEDGKMVDEYLIEKVNGYDGTKDISDRIKLPVKEKGKSSRSAFEILFPNGEISHVHLNVYHFNGTIGLPPEVDPYGLRLNPPFSSFGEGSYGVIDTQSIMNAETPVSELESLNEKIDVLHRAMKSIFENVTTEAAHEAWR